MQYPVQVGYQGGGAQHTGRPCREFSAIGSCKWGSNCRFSHDTGPRQQDMPRGPPTHRGNLCTQWVNTGRCNFGANCRFAHGEPAIPQYTNSGMQGMPQQQQRVPQQQQMPVQQMPPQPYSNMPHQQQQQPHRQMPSPADPQQLQRSHSSGGLMTPGPTPAEPSPPVHQQQQQQSQQQQQQAPVPAYFGPKPGKPTYVDCVRAICEALNIGNCGELVTDETRAAALRSFYTRALFRESRFADSVEQYLPAR